MGAPSSSSGGAGSEPGRESVLGRGEEVRLRFLMAGSAPEELLEPDWTGSGWDSACQEGGAGVS